jgi:hypothetical protein
MRAVPAIALRARPAEMVLDGGAELDAAMRCVELLEPGGRLFGFTRGEFSLLDLLRALLAKTGPADVVLATWTTGIRDAESAAWLLDSGRIRSLLILTDRSFPSRQPAYCARLVALFGAGAIVCTNNHAKFATIRNERWSVVVRSSMNLNRNRRFEQFDVDDDAAMADFVGGLVADVVATHQSGPVGARAVVDSAFDAVDMGGAAPVARSLLGEHRWAL